MKIEFSDNMIKFEKELNSLDMFALRFARILNQLDIRYVLVSGYVSILFGRSRGSEDIDIITEKLSAERFRELWTEVCKEFECIITSDVSDAYNNYLARGNAIRFADRGKFIPNIEMKFPKVELDRWTLHERKKVIVSGHEIFISPLELQIPFKLFLGSEKDIEDGKYLYELFKDNIDQGIMNEFIRKLDIKKRFDKYIRKT